MIFVYLFQYIPAKDRFSPVMTYELYDFLKESPSPSFDLNTSEKKKKGNLVCRMHYARFVLVIFKKKAGLSPFVLIYYMFHLFRVVVAIT
jgi:hypothetical protein